jgi:protein O-mannosyl-transferase
MGVRERALAALGLTALVLAAFAPVIGNSFVILDDPLYVTENAQVLRGLTLEGARWALTHNVVCNWYPLTLLSHMADVDLWGLDPRGHHLTSLLLHVANTLLLGAVLVSLTGRWDLSLAAAALFAVHPLRVESVAWVSERKDLLCAFFGLIALWLYAVWTRKGGWWRYVLLMLSFVASLASKPMLVTLPVLLLLLDVWPLGRVTSLRSAWRATLEKVPLLLVSVVLSIVAVSTQRAAGALTDLAVIPLWTRSANAAVSIWRYVGKLFWPVDLSPLYPLVAWPPGVVALAVVALVGSMVVAVALYRGRPYILVGWLWFCGLLVPVLGLVQFGRQSMADRYTYLPAMGIGIAVVWGLDGGLSRWLPARRRLLGLGLLGGALAAETVLTVRQADLWRDSVTLFSRAVAVNPGSAECWRRLGIAISVESRPADALPALSRATTLGPFDPLTHSTFARALMTSGHPQQAAAEYLEALRVLPADPTASLGLAWIRAADPDPRLRDPAAALALLRAVPEGARDPLWEFLDVEGVALAALGQLSDAAARAEAALAIAPPSAQAGIRARLAGYRRGTPFLVD